MNYRICKHCGEKINDSPKVLLDHLKIDHPDCITELILKYYKKGEEKSERI